MRGARRNASFSGGEALAIARSGELPGREGRRPEADLLWSDQNVAAESGYRRYAIVDEAMLRDAAVKVAARRGQSPGQSEVVVSEAVS